MFVEATHCTRTIIRKVVCLFVMLRSAKWWHSQCILGIVGKPSISQGVYQGGFIMLRPMVMQELLNIKQFFQREFSKIKTLKNKKFGCVSWYLDGNSSQQWLGFYGNDFINSRPKKWEIFEFWANFG